MRTLPKNRIRRVAAGKIGLAGLMFLSAVVGVAPADNNGPWTPEMSKSANKSPHDPPSPKGWYPPVEPSTTSAAPTPQPAAPAPAPAPTSKPANSNGGWTPEMSKSANKSPSDPPSPRGWYPPTDGSPDVPQNMGDPSKVINTIVTSNLANPLIQGGKAIGQTYEAADRGDNMGAAIEVVDGVGRLSAIGLGATEGATLGTAFGPLGTLIGGVVGGFIGNAGWNLTGGALNDSSRQAHQDQIARDQAQSIRQTAPSGRPSGGGGGGCGGACGR